MPPPAPLSSKRLSISVCFETTRRGATQQSAHLTPQRAVRSNQSTGDDMTAGGTCSEWDGPAVLLPLTALARGALKQEEHIAMSKLD
jgi:hypothetical protein